MAGAQNIGFELHNVEAYNEVTPADVDQPSYMGEGDHATFINEHPVPQPIGFEAIKGNADPAKLIGYKHYEDDGVGSTSETPKLVNGKDDDMSESEESGLVREASLGPHEASCKRPSLYFADGVRPIDYILAFPDEKDDKTAARNRKRECFEENLKKEGLQLEHVLSKDTVDQTTNFIKVHAPWETLTKFAEILKVKMPIQKNDMVLETQSLWDMCCSHLPDIFSIDESIVPEEPAYFTAAFNRERYDQYIVDDKETFFTPSQRSRIVYWIMTKTRYEVTSDSAKFGKDGRPIKLSKGGIRRLLNNGVFSAAFPLHEGDFESDHSIYAHGAENERHLLYEVWAKPRNWYKNQPLDLIRKYYGEKIGIYFTWLGYYTQMLIPAAIVGLVVFFYGVGTFYQDIKSDEICDENKAGSLIMCPLCDKACPWWRLKASCTYAHITHLFDNPATVFFAVFMALWATFFHEYWKRKEAFIQYDWDVAQFEDEEEQVRPEFEAAVKKTRPNPINNVEEPFLPAWNRCLRYFTALSIILFMLCLVIAALFGVIVYRIVIVGVFYALGQPLIEARAKLLTTVTAALINLVIIIFLNLLYTHVAKFLTNLEQHRTETEWEDSFTLKMFLFQFVNYYGSIFYIAFFKGRFVGRPGDYNYSLMGYRQEECDPAGCLIELCIQLAIIMVGKQTFNNFKEVILPKLMVWFKSRKIKKAEEQKADIRVPQWEEDYVLVDMPRFGLFDDYLEMVIQFGFVTIFVAAFPLAPLFALINNIIEIRLDAYKFVTQWRRPLAVRAEDIGIWFGILRGVTALAVLSNAFIVAFTSDFIPKLFYTSVHSPTGTLAGYVNYSLSYFDVSDFQNASIPKIGMTGAYANLTHCRYRAYRHHPDRSNHDYNYTSDYWLLFTIRLGFVIVFQNVIVSLTLLISYLVPDIPHSVKIQMLREKHLSDQAIIAAIKKHL